MDVNDWVRQLEGQIRRADDLTPVTSRLEQMGVAETKKRFSDSRGPDGEQWRPVKFRVSGSASRAKPLLDKGLLRGSIHGRHDKTSATVATNHAHARIQHSGGTVRAKKKFLAIPLTKEASRSGGPRRMQGLRAVVSRDGQRGVLIDRARQAHFALVKSVTIPARPFLGWSQRTLDVGAAMTAEYVTTGNL